MDIERLVVRVMADATQYLRVTGAVRAATLTMTEVMYAGGAAALSMAADFERATVAFEVMTRSATVGKALLDKITTLAIETPFTSAELIESSKQVLAFGFAVGDVIPVISRLGDISQGTGSRMDRLVLALGQVRTTGRLMGQELRQFTNAGVPILEYLADVMHVQSSQVPQLVRQGKVGFDAVAEAINRMTSEGGLFADMMDRINKETVYGRWQNLTESVQLTARNLGLAAVEAFDVRGALAAVGDAVRGLDLDTARQLFVGLRVAVFAVWKGLTAAATATWDFVKANAGLFKAVGTAIVVVYAVVAAFAAVVAVVKLTAAAFVFLTSPIGLAVAAVTALIVALDRLGMLDGVADSFRKAFAGFGDDMKAAWRGVVDAVRGNDLELAFDIMFKGVEVGWRRLMLAMAGEWDVFGIRLTAKTSNLGSDLYAGTLSINPLVSDAEKKQRLDEMARDRLARDKVTQDAIAASRAFSVANDPEMQRLQSDLLRLTQDAKIRSYLPKGSTGGNIEAAYRTYFRGGNALGGDPYDNVPGAPGQVGSAVLGAFAVESRYNDLYKDAVRRIEELSKAVVNKADEATLKRLGGEAQAAVKELDKFSDAVMGTGKAVRAGIATWKQISPLAREAADDINKQYVKGVGPLDQFSKGMRNIDEAVNGLYPTPGLNALVGNLGVSAIPRDILGGALGLAEADFGRFNLYEALQKTVGKPGDRLPPAMVAGSREATDTINRSSQQQLSVQEQVLQTLRDANVIQREQRDYARQVVDALKGAGVGRPQEPVQVLGFTIGG